MWLSISSCWGVLVPFCSRDRPFLAVCNRCRLAPEKGLPAAGENDRFMRYIPGMPQWLAGDSVNWMLESEGQNQSVSTRAHIVVRNVCILSVEYNPLLPSIEAGPWHQGRWGTVNMGRDEISSA